jgi:hypothetical protein
MNIYIAHVVFYTVLKEASQVDYPVWENVYHIRAESIDEARQLVEQRAELVAGDADGSYTVNGEKAEWVYAGIRKLFPAYGWSDGHIIELTYNDLTFKTIEDIKRFVNYETVTATFMESISEFEEGKEDEGIEGIQD